MSLQIKPTPRKPYLSRLSTFVASLAFSLATTQAAFAQVNISSVPLFLKESVDPNLMFVFDDSGSMGWRYMPDDLGGNGNEYYYSSAANKIYYDPDVTYAPPFKPDGSGRYPDSSYTNAPVNGFSSSSTKDNLSNYIRFDALADIEEGFYMELDETDPLCVSNPRNNDCYTAVLLNGASDAIKQNYANWYSFYSTRDKAAKSGITEAFFDLPENIRIGYGAINKGGSTIDGASNTYTVVSGARAYNNSRRNDFLSWLHNKNVSGGTPLRTALKDIGEYYSRSDNLGPWGANPGTNDNTAHVECRQSFAILMSDGTWNGSNPSNIDNADNTAGPTHTNPDPNGSNFTYSPVSPFSGGDSKTLADVAMKYWKNDLRTDLANDVPTGGVDPAFWQHMVTFTIGLGVVGSVDAMAATAAIASGDPINWPNPYNTSGKIDDLLHAAINGRGGYASAQNPQDFTTAIQGFLVDLTARAQTSASAAAVSSAVLRTESLGFFAGFRSEDWSGTLSGFNFNLGTEIWNAETVLANTAPTDRTLITHNGSDGVELAFTSPTSLSNLSTAQQAALNADPTLDAAQDNFGYQRLAWLHGDTNANAAFRIREGTENNVQIERLLGDIINANPQFVGKTNYGFARLPSPTGSPEGSSYGPFRSTTDYQDRVDALYVPANDGILHAFDSETGAELFGYIPGELLLPKGSSSHARISELMDPAYIHEYFMDGTPRIQDAYIDKDGNGKQWRTVLLGTMGLGGKTVFALDVTDPGSFSPADDVLWEFTNPNLGYGVTDPQIARLENGDWAAVFGNGYNGTSGESGLFVVNLADGSLIKEIPTGVGSAVTPNGLAAPTITSFPETDAVTRYAYAGDLLGNMWRFDLTGNVVADWSANRVFTAKGPSNNAQPITVAPRVALNPNDYDELVIAFGTGSFIQNGDESNYNIQSLYGIKDNLKKSNLDRSDLLQQTITTQEQVTVNRATGPGTNTFTIRETSDNDLTSEKGWYLDLIANNTQTGERVISRATFPFGVNSDRVRYTTMIPDDDPCSSGRTGFIMDLQLSTGKPSNTPVFDLDNDGIFNAGDIPGSYTPSGIQHGYGAENKTIATSNGDTEVVITGDNPVKLDPDAPCEGALCTRSLDTNIGRQTWEQLR